MLNTISARQIQREYKKVLQRANESKEPIVVMANNKPLGAVIGLDLLEKLQLEKQELSLEDYFPAGEKPAFKLVGEKDERAFNGLREVLHAVEEGGRQGMSIQL